MIQADSKLASGTGDGTVKIGRKSRRARGASPPLHFLAPYHAMGGAKESIAGCCFENRAGKHERRAGASPA